MTPDSGWSTVNIHSPVQTQFFIRSHFINQAVHNKNNNKNKWLIFTFLPGNNTDYSVPKPTAPFGCLVSSSDVVSPV